MIRDILRMGDPRLLRVSEPVRAFGTPELVQDALERGAYCVMNKPFDVHAIEGVIRNAHRDTRFH